MSAIDSTPSRHVHFVARLLATNWPDLEHLTERDVDAQPARFVTGVTNWVLQTYLHVREGLHSAGIKTSISESIRPHCVNVVHRDRLNRLSRAAKHATIVGARADRPPFELSDFEVLQNDVQPLSEHQFYIPFWPQPGLIARDPARGLEIRNVAYMGNTGTTSPWLQSASFRNGLAAMGVNFEIRKKRWSDYSDVDLVIGHRGEAPCMLIHKPASKLINAWLAGSPALLGDEPAYLSLKRDPLDYVSITSAEDVVQAIQKFRADPGLYKRFVTNGFERSRAYTVAQTTERWLRLLLDHALVEDQRVRANKTWPDQLRRLARQKMQSKMFKWQYQREIDRTKRNRQPDELLAN
jgi:hypothetical protein